MYVCVCVYVDIMKVVQVKNLRKMNLSLILYCINLNEFFETRKFLT